MGMAMGHHHTIGQGPISLMASDKDTAAITKYARVLVTQRGYVSF